MAKAIDPSRSDRRVTPNLRAWFWAGTLCALVVAADQAAKAAVEANFFFGEDREFLGPLTFTYTQNRGIAFGVARDLGAPILAGVSLAMLAVIGYFFARDPARPGMWAAIGFLVGGALGNMIDRVRADAVTDYIDIGFWLPPFNLADVTIGIGLLLLSFIYIRDVAMQDESG